MRQIGTWITCMVEQLRSISMYRCIFILSMYKNFKRVSQNNHYFASVALPQGVCFVLLLRSMDFFCHVLFVYLAPLVLCYITLLLYRCLGPRLTPMAKKMLSL